MVDPRRNSLAPSPDGGKEWARQMKGLQDAIKKTRKECDALFGKMQDAVKFDAFSANIDFKKVAGYRNEIIEKTAKILSTFD